jgi:nucleoside 2-deoxyribosyltransferase
MIIRGILDNSLNGQLCIRGFAPIRELARISKADYSYQRTLLDRSDITDFLEKQTYLFFPEIILGYKIKYSPTKSGDSQAPLPKIQAGQNYKSNFDNTQIKVKNVDFKQTQDLTGKNNIRIVDLIFDDAILENLIKEDKHPLSRIDGNHRLEAASKLDSPKVNRMVSPFCIILGEEFHSDKPLFEQRLSEFDKATKVFFYNINTKTVPLTSEENLKVLIDDEQCFSDSELEEIFSGIYPVKTRELIKKVNPNFFTGIKHILEPKYRTYYNDIFKRLLENGENQDNIVERVFESLQAIDQLYKTTHKLKSNSCFGLLKAFLYYHIEGNEMKFGQFKNWIFSNHLFDIDEIKAGSLTKIFDKIAEQEIKIFVAMPYFNNDPTVVREYNEIYEVVIQEIREKFGIKISLFPIMENKGETQDQIQDIINKIKQCSIFIADISNNNANVMYETGWARALDRHVLLFREKKSEKPKSDYANDTYHEYDDDARMVTLKKIAWDNITEVLNKNFGLVHE